MSFKDKRLWIATGLLAAGLAVYYAPPFGGTAKIKKRSEKPAFSPEAFQKYKVANITSISPNTKRIDFEIPKDENGLTKKFNLPVASFLLAKAEQNGKEVIRPYTPTTIEEDDSQTFSLVVKEYPQGALSKHICSLQAGDELEFKGPIKKIEYHPNEFTHVGLIAGGTGITPMYQVLKKASQDKNDKTKFTLIFANITEADILLRKELEALSVVDHKRFQIHYTLDNPPENWKYSKGYINEEMISKHLPKPEESKIKIFVCGNPPMVNSICGPKAPDYSQGELKGLLKNMGYSPEQVFKF